jgi:hypothetical protein
MTMEEIVDDGIYVYVCGIPRGVMGAKYRVIKAQILDVPSYQKKVLVEALTGKDVGLWFTCSAWNFIHRYRPDHQ